MTKNINITTVNKNNNFHYYFFSNHLFRFYYLKNQPQHLLLIVKVINLCAQQHKQVAIQIPFIRNTAFRYTYTKVYCVEFNFNMQIYEMQKVFLPTLTKYHHNCVYLQKKNENELLRLLCVIVIKKRVGRKITIR